MPRGSRTRRRGAASAAACLCSARGAVVRGPLSVAGVTAPVWWGAAGGMTRRVWVQGDVRVVVFSTLANEAGLMTGPRAMLQVSFHTSFADTGRHISFLAEDVDLLQVTLQRGGSAWQGDVRGAGKGTCAGPRPGSGPRRFSVPPGGTGRPRRALGIQHPWHHGAARVALQGKAPSRAAAFRALPPPCAASSRLLQAPCRGARSRLEVRGAATQLKCRGPGECPAVSRRP